MLIQVVEDDIANVPSDVLLTTIRQHTVPLGRIDSVIGRCAKQQFHNQARVALLIAPDTKVIYAKKHQHHKGKFEDVLFIVDDGEESIDSSKESPDDMLARGLDAASIAGCRSVSLPAIRMREGSRDAQKHQKISRMIVSLRHHEIISAQPIEIANIVIYNDTQLANDFRKEIDHTFSSL